MTDYYELLGVSRNATLDEIKRAYRKLAREFHPDIVGPGKEEEFKQLTRAYEVLSDPDNRRSYDMGFDPTAPRGGGMGGMGGFDGFPGGFPGSFGGGSFGGSGFGFSDIFETFFGGAAGGGGRGPIPREQRGKDALISERITLAEAVFGTKHDIELDTAVTCPLCHGSGCKAGTSPATCPVCHGNGHTQRMTRSFLGNIISNVPCAQCDGHGTVIPDPCPECRGAGRVREKHIVTVDIPAGVSDGTRIKLPGYGEAGPGGGPAGDLYVEVSEAADNLFQRKGDNLLATLEIPMTAAALGTVLELETLDGPREIRIKPGTQPGEIITLKSLGVGHLHDNGRGDLRVSIRVIIPNNLNEQQAQLLRAFETARGDEPSDYQSLPQNAGVFAKLRDKLSGK